MFLFACSKGSRYKVIANGEKYSLTIETENEIITHNKLSGKYVSKGRGESIGVYITPLTGETTVELFINGDLCDGVYAMSDNSTKFFNCQ